MIPTFNQTSQDICIDPLSPVEVKDCGQADITCNQKGYVLAKEYVNGHMGWRCLVAIEGKGAHWIWESFLKSQIITSK